MDASTKRYFPYYIHELNGAIKIITFVEHFPLIILKLIKIKQLTISNKIKLLRATKPLVLLLMKKNQFVEECKHIIHYCHIPFLIAYEIP
jgi:hypothetical protein